LTDYPLSIRIDFADKFLAIDAPPLVLKAEAAVEYDESVVVADVILPLK